MTGRNCQETLGRIPEGIRLLFKAVVQAVLLFGAETWALTP